MKIFRATLELEKTMIPLKIRIIEQWLASSILVNKLKRINK